MNNYFEVIIVSNGFIVRPIPGKIPGYCGTTMETHVFASATEVGKFLREQEKAINAEIALNAKDKEAAK